MSDKLEALSQPVAFVYQIAGACVSDYPNPCGKWVDWRTELSCEYPPDWMIEEGKVKDLKPRYSQEYVTALIQRVEAAKQREEHLKADAAVLGKQIAHQKICLDNEIKSNAWAFERIRELEQQLKGTK